MSATEVDSKPLLAVTRTTAASRRSRWERVTSSRGNPWRPRGKRHLRRSLSFSATETRRKFGVCFAVDQARLAQRLLVADEGEQGHVDELGQELGQSLGLAGDDLVEDQHLRAP